MKTRAPGKLVLSGAYSVLWGARAVVTAVDRYVEADTSRRPDMVTPEVAAALRGRQAPWFDASALRSEGRKLGLGSSAAIVVASVGALELDEAPHVSDDELARRTMGQALAAHRAAQGGGSGIDVAASTYGGTLVCAMRGDSLELRARELPTGVAILAYADDRSSSTAGMVAAVRAWAARERSSCERRMGKLIEHAGGTAVATEARAFCEGLRAQVVELAELGDAAGVPIVPGSLRQLGARAWDDGVVVMPSGAGGGDVVLCVGLLSEAHRWGRSLEAAGLKAIALRVGARGLRRV